MQARTTMPELPPPRGPVTIPGDDGDIAVLAAKLAPPPLGHAPVDRPRLFEVLQREVQRTPVTLLSGPAGSGKTVLAATWMRRAEGRPVAWLTLDDGDDDPAVFMSYLAGALSGAGVDVSGPSAAGDRAGFFGRLTVALLEQPRPVCLILDNADHLIDPRVLEGLDLLVRHAGRRLRLILCARADPQLPLHQYRVAGTMSEIRSDQLAFTPEETRELLRHLGAPVPAAVGEALCERTEGWAVGVRLAAAPLKAGMDPEELIASLAQDDGSVAQYLFEEVLKNQPAPVRRFLLQISVTAELWPELVDRLSGHRTGRRMLASLAQANAFVEKSARAPGGYRIHQLFREMLQAQLHFELPDEAAVLHRACASWYADAGRITEAVAQATAAEDWEFVAAVLVDGLMVGRLLTAQADPSLRSLDALPCDLPGAEAAVVRAAYTLSSRCTAEPHDLDVAASVARDPANRHSLRISGAVTALAGDAAGAGDGRRILEQADLAAQLLATSEDVDRRTRRELTAVVAEARATALLHTDAPDEQLLAGLRAAISASSRTGSESLRSRSLGFLALLQAIRGDLDRAGDLAREAEATGLAQSPAAVAAEGWVRVERYLLSDVRGWMTAAQTSPPPVGTVSVRPLLAVLQSRLLRLRHSFAEAERLLQPHLDDAGLPRWVRQQLVVEELHVRAARDGAVAVAELAPLEASPWRDVFEPPPDEQASSEEAAKVQPLWDSDPPLAVRVGAEVARSRLCLEHGAGGEAVRALQRALELAEPEAMRWPFLEASTQVRQLLRTHPLLRDRSTWLNPSAPRGTTSRGAGGAEEGAPAATLAPPVVQELSERELEVLRHLAEMLSTAEIAASMFVSVNTVRTHIRSILRKLSVSRRNEAVRRAKELRIL